MGIKPVSDAGRKDRERTEKGQRKDREKTEKRIGEFRRSEILPAAPVLLDPGEDEAPGFGLSN